MASMNIKINKNGPILVPGNVTYIDAEGNEQTSPGTMVALCRCGLSANKPFCDGNHRDKFEAVPIELVLKSE